MLTRYMYRSQLYSLVFEEPNLMTNIVSHLEAKDAVHLMMSRGSFTKEERFLDTMKVFLDPKKQEHEKMKAELEKRVHFGSTLGLKLVDLENAKGLENRKRLAIDILDFILENKHVLESPDFVLLKQIIHDKLVSFLRNENASSDFTYEALYYLGELFDVHVQAQAVPNTDDEYVEYIIDLNGERIWI